MFCFLLMTLSYFMWQYSSLGYFFFYVYCPCPADLKAKKQKHFKYTLHSHVFLGTSGLLSIPSPPTLKCLHTQQSLSRYHSLNKVNFYWFLNTHAHPPDTLAHSKSCFSHCPQSLGDHNTLWFCSGHHPTHPFSGHLGVRTFQSLMFHTFPFSLSPLCCHRLGLWYPELKEGWWYWMGI